MFISILLVLVAFALVVSVKARFDRFPAALRNLLLGTAALITGMVLTVELFIYGKRRVLEFLSAVEGIHWTIVLAVFLAIGFGAYWFFQLMTRINRDEVKRMYREHVKPMVGEVVEDVRSSWGGFSWRSLFLPSRPGRKDPDSSDQNSTLS